MLFVTISTTSNSCDIEGCKECISENNTCTSCDSDYDLKEDKCQTKCDNGCEFKDGDCVCEITKKILLIVIIIAVVTFIAVVLCIVLTCCKNHSEKKKKEEEIRVQTELLRRMSQMGQRGENVPYYVNGIPVNNINNNNINTNTNLNTNSQGNILILNNGNNANKDDFYNLDPFDSKINDYIKKQQNHKDTPFKICNLCSEKALYRIKPCGCYFCKDHIGNFISWNEDKIKEQNENNNKEDNNNNENNNNNNENNSINDNVNEKKKRKKNKKNKKDKDSKNKCMVCRTKVSEVKRIKFECGICLEILDFVFRFDCGCAFEVCIFCADKCTREGNCPGCRGKITRYLIPINNDLLGTL